MKKLKFRSSGEEVMVLQELLNEFGYPLKIDGSFGRKTDEAVRDFQMKMGLVSDGIVFTKTWAKLFTKAPVSWEDIEQKYLKEQDIIDFANRFDLEVAAVKAVQEVESSGRGFLLDGRPKILFEGHVFWRELRGRGIDPAPFQRGNEDVLFPQQTNKFYLGGKREYLRLEKAQGVQFNAATTDSALSACSGACSKSWGSITEWPASATWQHS